VTKTTKVPPQKIARTAPKAEPKPTGSIIDRHPVLLLALAAVVIYLPTIFYQLTELDDSIFIREFREYNENIGNLLTSFHRGLFDAVKDPYYRPLFLDTMILNYKLSNGGENIASYHVINILFHVLSTILLYKLFLKLGIRQLHSFLLSLVFAVHPVISQAVAWIPGRNDTLLAIFTFSFLLYSIAYTEDGRPKSLILSTLFLLLAFFTKETAVFAAPVAFVLLVLVMRKNWLDKKNITLYITWIGSFLVWYLARASATVQTTGVSAAQVTGDFIRRSPLIVQYLGKIFLPFNLSVFPIQQDTVYYYGIIAIAMLVALIVLSKQKDWRVVAGGFLVFLLFLLPALIVPQNLNEQSFEHRLYLPLAGILLVLSQTVAIKNKLSDKQLITGAAVVCAAFAGINYYHQPAFKDPVSFWSQAAETSPNSAYANMMYAARIPNDPERSYALFRRAYQLNPEEKYINFYYGEMLQKRDSVLPSEKYLLKEKQKSNYYMCDFYLARVAMEKQDPVGAITYLQSYLKHDPNSPMANNNLLLLYKQTNQLEAGKAHIRHMQQSGLSVPPALSQQFGI
jgi:4-amino-4-deoxy-L-arabinose transferase-like glycosyltransferase